MVRLEGRVPRHQTALLSADASCKQFKFTIQNCYDDRDDDDDKDDDFDDSKPAYCLAAGISAAISLAVCLWQPGRLIFPLIFPHFQLMSVFVPFGNHPFM